MPGKYIYRLLMAVAVVVCLGSCKKMLDVESHRAVAEENMWQTKNDAWAGSFACYGLVRAALVNENAYWVYGDLRGGDFTITKRGDLQAVTESKLTSNYTTMDQWRDWRRFYAAIDQCNVSIENLPKVPQRDYRYSKSEMKLDLAQVRVLRAFLYFYMVRVWGNVPFLIQSGDSDFQNIAKADQKTILDFCVSETLAAYKDLPWRYNGEFPEAPGDYRGQGESHFASIAVTKGIALTLIAHIYAWQHNYEQAAVYCDQVVDNQKNTTYAFVTTDVLTKLDGVFRGRGSAHNIFQLDFNVDHAEYSTTGQLEDWTLREPHIPKKESEIYVSKDSIIDIFNESGDNREDYYFTRMDEEHPEFYKLKQINSIMTNPPLRFYTSAVVVFRYEELFLLRAEARTALGRIDDAIADLNLVRAQRGLQPLASPQSKEDLVNYILQERRRELMGEGWRWFDLVRMGKVKDFTSLTQEDIDNGAAYWPVSKSALQQNGLLEQLNYWK
ncbi:RagB/SusD family nutrient uptake outer membrane protein [Arachidicoccus terrestris]|uniref:RagB/SusD family nutrient uptake outer membrane protein n=1 Tax=Arachidicoccus terrestris TaxID=2875539 RepID=UPI001CC6A59D|nr:RagB/SusD family nutrient uptake outer membrane protein [Arachidicoccus terrestris]UAY54210.1 RagB/SusD family nutrient uptake outer membrane protein [Arachidicoccus terrestris]